MRRSSLLCAFALFLLVSRPVWVAAQTFAADDVLVLDDSRVLRIDPLTGDRSLVSGAGVGSGPALARALCIEVEPGLSPMLLVAEFDGFRITRIDPATGDRTTVSSASVGSGPSFRPFCLTLGPDGTIYVVDGDTNSILSVDPSTGDRTVLSSSTVGSGPTLSNALGLLYYNDEAILVADAGLDAVVVVDPSNGNRSIFSSDTEGAGPFFGTPRDLSVAANGNLLVVDSGLDALVEVDVSNGDRSIVSDATTGVGDAFDFVHNAATEAEGAPLVANFFGLDLHRIDPPTGDRSLVSGSGVGTGPPFLGPRDVEVVRDSRLLFGFEFDAPGGLPAAPGLSAIGVLSVEDPTSFFSGSSSIDAPQGSQVLYLTTGPGANGGGDTGSDETGDGNNEMDQAFLQLFVTRLPNDPATLRISYDVLTSETAGGGVYDPVWILRDLSPILAAAANGPNGSLPALTGFDGTRYDGADASFYTQGRRGFGTLEVDVGYGTHQLNIAVADEADDSVDTALLVDDIRFVPEPDRVHSLCAGLAWLVALLGARRSRRDGFGLAAGGQARPGQHLAN